jgi:hypothetical protein
MDKLLIRINQEPVEIRKLIARFHFEDWFRDLQKRVIESKKGILIASGHSPNSSFNTLRCMIIEQLYGEIPPVVAVNFGWRKRDFHTYIVRAMEETGYKWMSMKTRINYEQRNLLKLRDLFFLKRKEILEYEAFLNLLENE